MDEGNQQFFANKFARWNLDKVKTDGVVEVQGRQARQLPQLLGLGVEEGGR